MEDNISNDNSKEKIVYIISNDSNVKRKYKIKKNLAMLVNGVMLLLCKFSDNKLEDVSKYIIILVL